MAKTQQLQKVDDVRKISDLRRVVQATVNWGTGRMSLSVMPGNEEQMKLSDKWKLLPDWTDQNALPVSYVGILMSGVDRITVARFDKRILKPQLFRMGKKPHGVEDPSMNVFLETVGGLLARSGCPDMLPLSPNVNDASQYPILIGRQWFIQAGMIDGRVIRHIRVWEGVGLIATTSANSLFFLPMDIVLDCAFGDRPLPNNSSDGWRRIHREEFGGSIGFVKPVYQYEGRPHITIATQSGRERNVPLGDPFAMATALAEREQAQSGGVVVGGREKAAALA